MKPAYNLYSYQIHGMTRGYIATRPSDPEDRLLALNLRLKGENAKAYLVFTPLPASSLERSHQTGQKLKLTRLYADVMSATRASKAGQKVYTFDIYRHRQ